MDLFLITIAAIIDGFAALVNTPADTWHLLLKNALESITTSVIQPLLLALVTVWGSVGVDGERCPWWCNCDIIPRALQSLTALSSIWPSHPIQINAIWQLRGNRGRWRKGGMKSGRDQRGQGERALWLSAVRSANWCWGTNELLYSLSENGSDLFLLLLFLLFLSLSLSLSFFLSLPVAVVHSLSFLCLRFILLSGSTNIFPREGVFHSYVKLLYSSLWEPKGSKTVRLLNVVSSGNKMNANCPERVYFPTWLIGQ